MDEIRTFARSQGSGSYLILFGVEYGNENAEQDVRTESIITQNEMINLLC